MTKSIPNLDLSGNKYWTSDFVSENIPMGTDVYQNLTEAFPSKGIGGYKTFSSFLADYPLTRIVSKSVFNVINAEESFFLDLYADTQSSVINDLRTDVKNTVGSIFLEDSDLSKLEEIKEQLKNDFDPWKIIRKLKKL
ncbi:hypothetical protein HC823_02435 [Candidatus Gracilibacteria bacterium]|nr:hypothetical protein [Candidatus Gracilibacteria bacterium]